MNQRMSGSDHSLNTPLTNTSGEEGTEWQDWLEDERPDQETHFETEELGQRRALCKMLCKI